uniref:Cullin-5 n=1 Tax=Glossina palpalis gambiensis TaxID=67801 RepID=A0A1B0BP26_9MUSC
MRMRAVYRFKKNFVYYKCFCAFVLVKDAVTVFWLTHVSKYWWAIKRILLSPSVLLDRVPNGIYPMLRDVENHIVSAGLADMLSASEIITQDSENYVEPLLELLKKFSALIKNAFSDDQRLATRRSSCTSFATKKFGIVYLK